MPGGIFINYRGEDSQTAAALIDRELVDRFGADQVFLDNRSIPAGVDFTTTLLRRLRASSVLLVVIGPRWLALTAATGERRIDVEADWVRREIREAFQQDMPVIPVLVDGATLPTAAQLPDDIADLSRRQYLPLRRRYVTVDLGHLVERVVEAAPALNERTRSQLPAQPAPRQLPPGPRWFTGRNAELAELTTAAVNPCGGGTTVWAITGTGGIGKTWLALHWAYQHLDLFPDGQLFLDLRGFEPSGRPMSTAEAVLFFLSALGVEPAAIPAETDVRLGLYRSLMAGRRILVILDNARDAPQIVDLLPGTTSGVVIVTSRDRLTELEARHGTQRLALDVLSDDEGQGLLTLRVGRRRARNSAAVAEILEHCGGLPLALALVAGRAVDHSRFELLDIARELRDATTRLGVLDSGGPAASLSATLSWSFAALSAVQVRVLGLLSLIPGPDIGIRTAASLVASTTAELNDVLRSLERVSLVEEHLPGRWRMHDLVRLYASDRARTAQLDSGKALRRFVDHCIHTAEAGERLIAPRRATVELNPVSPGTIPEPLADHESALIWFTVERHCLLSAHRLATDLGWNLEALQLAWVMTTLHWRCGHVQDLVDLWQRGLATARQLDDPSAHALAHRQLGNAYILVGRHRTAMKHLRQALASARTVGDATSEAYVHRALALAWEQDGDLDRALLHSNHAMRLHRELDHPAYEAMELNAVGWYEARLGRYELARLRCETALRLARHHCHRDLESAALDSLGYIAHNTGQHQDAVDHYRHALDIRNEVGNMYGAAGTLERLGDAYLALDRPRDAAEVWRRARNLYRVQHRVDEFLRVQSALDALDDHRRHPAPRTSKKAATGTSCSSGAGP